MFIVAHSLISSGRVSHIPYVVCVLSLSIGSGEAPGDVV